MERELEEYEGTTLYGSVNVTVGGARVIVLVKSMVT